MSKAAKSNKFDHSLSTDLVVNQVNFKSKKCQRTIITIPKKFLQEVLNQSKMKKIRNYLKQHQSSYANKTFQANKPYSLYEDYLLLNTLKECEDKIYQDNMQIHLSQIKIRNSQRTLIAYYFRLFQLIDNLQKAQIKQYNRKIRDKTEVNTFMSKLRQSNFKQNTESIMNILDEIETSVNIQNSYFTDPIVHEDIFFSDEQQKQDNRNHHNHYHSLIVEENSSKKQRKAQKQKRKQKITKIQYNNFTFIESFIYESKLQCFRQKWRKNQSQIQQTVYEESIQTKQQDSQK